MHKNILKIRQSQLIKNENKDLNKTEEENRQMSLPNLVKAQLYPTGAHFQIRNNFSLGNGFEDQINCI